MQSGTKTVNTGNKKQRHARRRFTFSEPTPTAELELMKGSGAKTIEAFGKTLGLEGPDVQNLHGEEREGNHLPKKTQSMPTIQTPKGIKPEANGHDQVLGLSASQGKTPTRKRLTSSQTRTYAAPESSRRLENQTDKTTRPKSCGNLGINQAAPRWAAGGFANSPPPSSLPLPAFDFDDIAEAEPSKMPQPQNMDTVVANQAVPEPMSSSSPPSSHALSIQPLNQSPQIMRNSPPESRLYLAHDNNVSYAAVPTNIDPKHLHLLSPSPRRATHPLVVMSPSHSMPNLHGVISTSPPINKPVFEDHNNNNVLGQPVVMAISPPPYGYAQYAPQPGAHSPPTPGGNLEQLSSELRRMLNIPVLATK